MIEGVEWLFIVLIVVLLFFYEPQKISQIAKAIAQAKKEYEKASSAIMEQIEKESQTVEEKEVKPNPLPFEHEPESADVHIIKFAKMFNINTYGKTKEEITAEVVKKGREYFFGEKTEQTLEIKLNPETNPSGNENNTLLSSDQSSNVPKKELQNEES